MKASSIPTGEAQKDTINPKREAISNEVSIPGKKNPLNEGVTSPEKKGPPTEDALRLIRAYERLFPALSKLDQEEHIKAQNSRDLQEEESTIPALRTINRILRAVHTSRLQEEGRGKRIRKSKTRERHLASVPRLIKLEPVIEPILMDPDTFFWIGLTNAVIAHRQAAAEIPQNNLVGLSGQELSTHEMSLLKQVNIRFTRFYINLIRKYKLTPGQFSVISRTILDSPVFKPPNGNHREAFVNGIEGPAYAYMHLLATGHQWEMVRPATEKEEDNAIDLVGTSRDAKTETETTHIVQVKSWNNSRLAEPYTLWNLSKHEELNNLMKYASHKERSDIKFLIEYARKHDSVPYWFVFDRSKMQQQERNIV